ncbi:PNPOx family protein [Cumulibacter manganitolerans]|uniref:pyridoxamine 5'-phosphate oxidase family protein n=1 Tax=Cumulibacter manganitolerans TaxID=1884992 RepID=UPI0012961332|nr:pyridoxamine 5'-phosphate oxidase family protein [Cumulibacter manganitolerans]
MRLSDTAATGRLEAAEHGVLGTVHAERGVDTVPVVYAVDGGAVGIPIDRIKGKRAGLLQRERNLSADPRASLLVEHWDRSDWSRLWWVRATLRWDPTPGAIREDRLSSRLAERFEQYRDAPFDRILVLRVVAVAGWTARRAAGGTP